MKLSIKTFLFFITSWFLITNAEPAQSVFVDPSAGACSDLAPTNTGTGTCTVNTVSAFVSSETVTFTATTSGSGATFSVAGSVSGFLGTITAGSTQTISDVNHYVLYTVTLSNGGTPYLVGDNFRFTATAGTELKASNFNLLTLDQICLNGCSSTSRTIVQNGNREYGLRIGADTGAATLTNATGKRGTLSAPHYLNAEEAVAIIFADMTVAGNDVYIGGGAPQANAATSIKFYTAATNSTTAGAENGSLDLAGTWILGGTISTVQTLKGNIINIIAQAAGAASVRAVAGDTPTNGNASDYRARGNSNTSANTTQASFIGQYGTVAANRNLAQIDILNTSATASASGGQMKLRTATTAGTMADGATIDENQKFTAVVQLIGKGTATNDNAATGYIGEYVQSASAVATNVPAATATWGNVTSISLTAGDWDVTGVVNFKQNGATVSGEQIAISVNSGVTTTDHVIGQNFISSAAVPSASFGHTISVPTYRLSIASTTTVYLKTLATYTVATPQTEGYRISARRVR